jgi:hypothetical protein
LIFRAGFLGKTLVMAMSPTISWTDAAVRLALAVAVGIVVGYDRSTRGKAAGMRTTVLVCVAAAVAMIQVNMLLLTAGRPSGSFVMNDLMRLGPQRTFAFELRIVRQNNTTEVPRFRECLARESGVTKVDLQELA